jgi:hypothetical protein
MWLSVGLVCGDLVERVAAPLQRKLFFIDAVGFAGCSKKKLLALLLARRGGEDKVKSCSKQSTTRSSVI